MSLKILTKVWDNSEARLGERLVLLAIADYADENGVAFPSIATLARKSQMCDRQVQRCIKELCRIGELSIEEHQGPRGCHIFTITDKVLRVTNCHGCQIVGVTNPAQGVTFTTPGGDILSENASKMSPKPSGTVIEPSIEPSAGANAGEEGQQRRAGAMPPLDEELEDVYAGTGIPGPERKDRRSVQCNSSQTPPPGKRPAPPAPPRPTSKADQLADILSVPGRQHWQEEINALMRPDVAADASRSLGFSLWQAKRWVEHPEEAPPPPLPKFPDQWEIKTAFLPKRDNETYREYSRRFNEWAPSHREEAQKVAQAYRQQEADFRRVEQMWEQYAAMRKQNASSGNRGTWAN
jgi:hypothetical protein